MKKNLLILTGVILIVVIAFFVWGENKMKKLQAIAKECTEKNLCLDADNFKCIECAEESTETPQPQKAMWSGVLTKADVTSYQYGTHQLKGTALDGNPDNVGKEILFAIKSDNINLDEWIGKNIIITGTKVEGYPVENGPEFINVTAIENDQEVKAQ